MTAVYVLVVGLAYEYPSIEGVFSSLEGAKKGYDCEVDGGWRLGWKGSEWQCEYVDGYDGTIYRRELEP